LDIRLFLARGDLEITPRHDDAVRPASVDLRLGALLTIADPNQPDGWRVHDLREASYRLYPGMFILGHTLETVRISNALCGVLAGKSSRAREGLIVEAAGYVDPEWHGELTVEMAKLGPGYALLTLGQWICQIRFETLSSPCERGYGHPEIRSHYQHSRGPVPSRAAEAR
jgi:dCTP deaminase